MRELEAHEAGEAGVHAGELALAQAERLDHGALILVGHVDDELLERFEQAAARVAVGDHLGLGDAELHAFAAHLLDQDGEVQLAAARDLDAVGTPQVFDAQRHVDAQLALEAVLDLAQGHGAAVLAGERAVVDQEEHADGGLLDLERRQGDGGRVELRRGQRVADGDLVGPREPDDVAGGDLLDLAVLEAMRDPEMGDAGRLVAHDLPGVVVLR